MDSIRPRLAVFDLDGTLTRRDTSLAFLRAAGGRGTTARLVPALAPPFMSLLGTWLVGLLGGDGAGARTGAGEAHIHEAAVGRILSGLSRDLLLDVARGFAAEGIEPLLRPEVVRRLQEHRERGDTLALVTASLEVSVEPWARRRGFHHVLGTRLDLDTRGLVTGRFQGRYCWGEEKVRRLESVLGSLEGWHLTAYGDSAGDEPLLARADEAVRVGSAD